MPKQKIVRYAVVGLGYFAQGAVLPAFAHTKKNSRLTAFVSGDPKKHRALGAKYGVKLHYSYDQYEECLRSGEVDAVYIVLPNHMHAEYTVRAAKAGIHVLCEKPMATTEEECQEMIQACEQADVRLMIAYRLHFEPMTLAIIDLIKKKKIGEPKFFSSVFSHEVVKGNIRAREDVGGGALWDIGVYCVNAARYLFREEPTHVFAVTANTDPERFQGVDESATAVLRFPGERMAQFTVHQSSSKTSEYRIVGTKGDIKAEPAYDYQTGLSFELTVGGKKQTRKFPKLDQMAAEITYFSECVIQHRNPEPSGQEGLADVRIIEALYRSSEEGQPVQIEPVRKRERPDSRQRIERPPVNRVPEMVNAEAPSGS